MVATHGDAAAPTGLLRRVEFDALVRRGVFDDAKVELLYGRVVSMSPQGGPHRYSVTRLTKVLLAAVGDRANVHVRSPFVAPGESEPEPDVAVVPPGDYLDEHPSFAWLVVEVAESSLSRDRAKARLYGAARVTEYWIVNLAEGVIEVHRDPTGDGYASVTRYDRAAVLAIPGFAGEQVAASDILPGR